MNGSTIENSCITKYVYQVLNKIINQSTNQSSKALFYLIFLVLLSTDMDDSDYVSKLVTLFGILSEKIHKSVLKEKI